VKARAAIKGRVSDAKVEYVTPRGPWYHYSWKSDVSKSGGLATNIGVHLFDLCGWLFGRHIETIVLDKTESSVSGSSCFGLNGVAVSAANGIVVVEWRLAVNGERQRSFRFKSCGNDIEINIVSGFEDLHAETYRRVLAGEGFGIEDARQAIQIVEGIRNAG
jgi:UDP-N-acetyl-2-amino-2-deoxyglucuronate dehydrogenase